MQSFPLELALLRAERVAMLAVIRAHPEWTLGALVSYVERDGTYAEQLLELTVGELLTEELVEGVELPDDGGPAIDVARLERAKRLEGARFDAEVLAILADADRPVKAAYLRARLGGPRWKLRASLDRLEHAGEVERTGNTSNTRYRKWGSS